LQRPIQARVLFDRLVLDTFVEDEGEDRRRRVNRRVAEEEHAVVDLDRDVEVDQGEDGLDERNDHSSVDDELTQRSSPFVGQSSVPDDQPHEILEASH